MVNLKDKKVGVISLGCDKNRVDSEKMLANIEKWANITNELEDANILIINTCAFLESSRKESIETIFDCNNLRNNGNLEKIVVTGCLPQKYVKDIFEEFKEVDLFLGFKDYDLLKQGLELCYKGERINFVDKGNGLKTVEKISTTAPHYTYLKIADGCNNHCTYCLIPKIRGKYVSEKMEFLLEEAESYGDVEELILVAQDITRYGVDLYGEPKLVELLQKLSKLENIKTIRLLYCYPDMIDDKLIDEIANNPKILKYIDIPLQHVDNKILKLMNRKGTREEYLELINKLKTRVPNIAIRSTFITGFSGETEVEFENLKSFLNKAQLLNAGFFAYSREKDTPSYKLKGVVTKRVKQKRLKELYSLQKQIADKLNSEFVGKTVEVICDGIDYEKQTFVGRTYFQAPDIDGKVYFTSNNVIEQGKRYKVKVHSYFDYDLYGEEIQ